MARKKGNSKRSIKPSGAPKSNSKFWIGIVLAGVVFLIAGVMIWKPFGQQVVDSANDDTTDAKNELPDESSLSSPESESPESNDGTDFDELTVVEQHEQAISTRLKKLSEKFTVSNGLKPELVGQFVSSEFSSIILDSDRLTSVFSSPANAASKIDVSRLDVDDKLQPTTTDDFLQFMESLLAPILPSDSANSRLRSKFKVYRINVLDDTIETGILASFFAVNSETTSGEFNSSLDIVWSKPKPGATRPLMVDIKITNYECVRFAGVREIGFTDCTASFIGDDRLLQQQFSWGAEQWSARIAEHGVFGYIGIAVGDVNGDGLDDVYYCQPFGLPNRLFVQQDDGTTKEVSGEWNIDLCDHTRSALFLDLDNDGHQDLLIGAQSSLMVFRNDGSGSFELKHKFPAARSGYSLSAADYDNDGDLDFYVCSYYGQGGNSLGFPFAYPMHDANNGGRNSMFRNDGNWEFKNVTVEVGLDENNTKYSFAAGWQDYDNDGDQDLYVANDYGRNCFYENQNGQFRNRAAELDIEDQSFGMSVDWADVNHDGRMDLYVSNMYSTAGNRLSFQDSYLSKRPELQKRMQYMARGNSLFLGNENGFTDVGDDANVYMGRWAWGSKFVDLNNDGWDDVVVANGFLTRKIADDL